MKKSKLKKDKKLPEKLKALENLLKNMTLPEKRFFTIYLAKINTNNSTGTVKFSLAEFRKIMDLKKETEDINYFRKSINNILNKTIEIPEENNYNKIVHLLCNCGIYNDHNDKLFLEITSYNNILSLLIDFSEYYFKNHIWNYFFLKSENQIRMYKLMRCYFNIGVLEIDIDELKKLLGLRPEEYRRFESFRIRVLVSCQKALAENTDICYTYKGGKSDINGQWTSIIFYIEENENFTDPLRLSEFI
ncbi:MAG: replication initiation protein [Ruminococcus sp.]|nr:replication initiation protein [Ruminococcus sp.]